MENVMNILKLYRAANGEIRNLVGWEHWARNYYGYLNNRYIYSGTQTEYESEMDQVLLPDDWFNRVKAMLQLESLGE